MYHRLRNHFGRTRWLSLVTLVIWNLVSVHLDLVLVSMQDRCSVSRQTYQSLRIILDETDGTPSDDAQVEARFGRFGDSANPNTR